MKEKLIEAINATIVPNDEKAITAESLANLLVEIVEAMGTGNGEQIVFYAGLPTEEISETTGLMKMSLTPEQKQHNAEMFAQLRAADPARHHAIDLSEAYNDAMGANGIKYCFEVFYSLFVPKDAAEMEIGIDQDVITGFIDPSHFIYADGSVELDFS